ALRITLECVHNRLGPGRYTARGNVPAHVQVHQHEGVACRQDKAYSSTTVGSGLAFVTRGWRALPLLEGVRQTCHTLLIHPPGGRSARGAVAECADIYGNLIELQIAVCLWHFEQLKQYPLIEALQRPGDTGEVVSRGAGVEDTKLRHTRSSPRGAAVSLARRTIPAGTASCARSHSATGCSRPPAHAGQGWGLGAPAAKKPRWHW